MSYALLRPLLFRLDPEIAHRLSLATLDTLALVLPGRLPRSPRRVMGLEFPNPVGLAAGLDKDGEHIDALGRLGFGFVEVGTVTPRPQPGNPRPRLFRLPEARALINRMGFNNRGVDRLLDQLRHVRYRGLIGVNIGKNRDTPLERAHEDYLHGLERVYPRADYVAVNISSPNTPGLRDLQFGEPLNRLLGALAQARARLADQHGRYVPLAVKVAPDMADGDIPRIVRTLLKHRIDGLIATNTTATRPGVAGLPHADEAGGLSGAPLAERATEVLRLFASALDGALPIIAVGGILSGADARDRLAAGAALVQIYTGLIYRGPALVREVTTALADTLPTPESRDDHR
jgi:dihydroorotate dehydrogenase